MNYSLLTVDVGFYLPAFKAINVYWMKAMMAGKKKAVRTSEVKYLYAPQHKSLSVDNVLAFGQQFE